MAQTVSFLGLGIMGSRMAANLRRAGFELVVWNRTRAKAEQFAAEHGAEVAASPAEAGTRSDLVVTMLVDGPQVENVLAGEEGVASAAGDRDVLCIDMSTIGPVAARRTAAGLGERGVRFVDAPVTGSSPKAEDGTLTIMAGAEREDFERARPLFEAMGELIVHVGPVGHGQIVKIVNNAEAAGSEFDFAARTAEILAESEALGHGDDDFAALLAALEKRSGISLP